MRDTQPLQRVQLTELCRRVHRPPTDRSLSTQARQVVGPVVKQLLSPWLTRPVPVAMMNSESSSGSPSQSNLLRLMPVATKIAECID